MCLAFHIYRKMLPAHAFDLVSSIRHFRLACNRSISAEGGPPVNVKPLPPLCRVAGSTRGIDGPIEFGSTEKFSR
jgi:hypothetical protein